MAYASIDKLKKSWMQVSDFNSGLNQANIISHSEESRRRLNYDGVNDESMKEYRKYLRLDDDCDIPSPSYDNYGYGRRRSTPPKSVAMGRGKLIREAAEMSGNYNHQFIRDRKVKQLMYEAGISPASNRDMKTSFYEIFKNKDDEVADEIGSWSNHSSAQSSTSEEISSEQEVDDLVTKFSKTPSPSDLNNNDNRGRGRGCRSSVYVPPHRRKEEVGEPVETAAVVEKKEEIGFADWIRKAEMKKSQPRPVVLARKTISELLADPGWDEKPKDKTAPAPRKCRNAVMMQFLPKHDAETETKEASNPSPPISLIPDDQVPTARRLMDSFIPEEPKPRQFTLEDYIIKKSPKKNNKK